MGTVLITGGFGYIGGRLAQHLVRNAGKHVVLSTRTPSSPPRWLPNASVVDITELTGPKSVHAFANIEAVVHLAGMNAQQCAADPSGALAVNGLQTAALLAAAVQAGVPRFLYVSTIHVYGSPLRGVITEIDCATSLHPYATSHRAGEDAVLFAHDQKKIEGVAIRLSNSFGAPVHEQVNCWMLLVNDLCRQAVAARRMKLNSAGLQRRDFITLDDACRAIAHLLQMESRRLDNGLFNVGGAWAPTVMEMTNRIAECCEQALGFRPEIVRPPPREGEASQSLDYRIDKLLESGFTLTGDTDAQIIDTLKFCVVHPGQETRQA